MEQFAVEISKNNLLGAFPRLSKPGALNSEALNRAYAHVSKSWLPIDEDCLHYVREQLQRGEYRFEPEQLLHDLKRDYALYLFVLKELAALPASPLVESSHPEAMIKHAREKELIRILDAVPNHQVAQHFPWVSDSVEQHHQQVTTGACCAEVIAERWNLDSEIAFLSAVLRQLGITLIRWNYPHISQRAFRQVRSDADFDSALEQLLGFSPVMLGIKFAIECGLSREVFYSFYGPHIPSEIEIVLPPQADDDAETAQAYLAICEISDALVRAAEPESYPAVQVYWEELQDSLCEELGSDIFLEIKNRAQTEAAIALHQRHAEHRELQQQEAQERVGHLIRLNRHLKYCPIEVRDKLLSLYLRMRPGAVSHRSLSHLVRRVILDSGFSCGCIFTRHPELMVLQPLTVIGKPPKSMITPKRIYPATGASDPVVSAYQCALPYRDEPLGEQEETSYLASLGTTRKVGVLVLRARCSEERSEELFHAFKAIHHALNDFLNV